ncbi:hypothetical protein FB451DRAFT_1449094 [Mycena latifolia]|nr:hypothetical protein FB451DRAFT_1449094 [Mycena latifolia]
MEHGVYDTDTSVQPPSPEALSSRNAGISLVTQIYTESNVHPAHERIIAQAALTHEAIFEAEAVDAASDDDDDDDEFGGSAAHGSIISWSSADQLGPIGILYVILALILVRGRVMSDREPFALSFRRADTLCRGPTHHAEAPAAAATGASRSLSRRCTTRWRSTLTLTRSSGRASSTGSWSATRRGPSAAWANAHASRRRTTTRGRRTSGAGARARKARSASSCEQAVAAFVAEFMVGDDARDEPDEEEESAAACSRASSVRQAGSCPRLNCTLPVELVQGPHVPRALAPPPGLKALPSSCRHGAFLPQCSTLTALWAQPPPIDLHVQPDDSITIVNLVDLGVQNNSFTTFEVALPIGQNFSFAYNTIAQPLTVFQSSVASSATSASSVTSASNFVPTSTKSTSAAVVPDSAASTSSSRPPLPAGTVIGVVCAIAGAVLLGLVLLWNSHRRSMKRLAELYSDVERSAPCAAPRFLAPILGRGRSGPISRKLQYIAEICANRRSLCSLQRERPSAPAKPDEVYARAGEPDLVECRLARDDQHSHLCAGVAAGPAENTWAPARAHSSSGGTAATVSRL